MMTTIVQKVNRLQKLIAEKDNTISDLEISLNLNRTVIKDLLLKLNDWSQKGKEHKRKKSWWTKNQNSKLNETFNENRKDSSVISDNSLDSDLLSSMNSLIQENIILQNLLIQKGIPSIRRNSDETEGNDEAEVRKHNKHLSVCKEIQTDFSQINSIRDSFNHPLCEASNEEYLNRISKFMKLVSEYVQFNQLLADEDNFHRNNLNAYKLCLLIKLLFIISLISNI